MAATTTNIISGPARALLTDAEVGHSQGGIEATITPQNRARNVDQFGVSEIAIIHTGDEVRVMIPLAQYDAANLAEVYNPGNDQTAAGSTGGGGYMGIGRSAGYTYTTQDLKLTPRLAADAGKRVQFWAATPIGQFTQMFDGGETDRIFEVEFACLADVENQVDGELIGKLQLADLT